MFDLSEENFNEVIQELLEKPKDTLPIFINMMMGECTVGQCSKFMKDLHIVADIVKRQNRVAIIDCGSRDSICHKIPKPQARSSTAAIYMRGGKIYEFEGN